MEIKKEKAILAGRAADVMPQNERSTETSMEELAALVETAGGESVGMILQSREKPDPHSFIGEGKVEEVKRMVENSEATMVIFDNDLSPSQVRVLTELCGVQVLDRSGLILDIFAQRARTKEGCLQVELAQYQYLLPRLIGMWSHLERQGGTGGSQGQHFGMGGGVVAAHRGVAAARKHAAIGGHHHRAHRNLARRAAGAGLFQSHTHQPLPGVPRRGRRKRPCGRKGPRGNAFRAHRGG